MGVTLLNFKQNLYNFNCVQGWFKLSFILNCNIIALHQNRDWTMQQVNLINSNHLPNYNFTIIIIYIICTDNLTMSKKWTEESKQTKEKATQELTVTTCLGLKINIISSLDL